MPNGVGRWKETRPAWDFERQMCNLMDTKIVRLKEGDADEEALLQAGEILKAGGLVAFPTETVYGLGGDALNPDSSRKIYAAKGRPSDNPLIVHICRMEDLEKITTCVSEKARRLAARFWPGPLTMILPKRGIVPKETTGGLETVAVRMPSHPAAGDLWRRPARTSPEGPVPPWRNM